jgi:hypothetical protein
MSNILNFGDEIGGEIKDSKVVESGNSLNFRDFIVIQIENF